MVLYIALTLLYEFQYENIKHLLPDLRNRGTSLESNMTRESSNFRRFIHQFLALDAAHKGDSMVEDVDIHVLHPSKGHTGETTRGHLHHGLPHSTTAIAIGGGITSAKLKDVTVDNIPEKFQFFFSFMPSFCSTASKGYGYHFYLAYDHTDAVFSQPNITVAFHRHFMNYTSLHCPRDPNTSFSLHFVQCSHSKKPAWAQNDAMMEAYLDDVEYFYRVNDDSILRSGNWTPAFIDTLAKYVPARVGVVGPKHAGGNMGILTYDFVHKTHVDIFGFYYPRFFTDWWADDWMTKVYRPDHSTKLPHIGVRHTMKTGQRYRTNWSKRKGVGQQITDGQQTLKRYLYLMSSLRASKPRIKMNVSPPKYF